MKKIIALLLLAATPASSQTIVGSSTGTIAVLGPKVCVVTYKAGQISTSSCDFSAPLSRPRFFPGDRDELKIEFDQAITATSGTFTTTPLNR
jgi:hypothetical protein